MFIKPMEIPDILLVSAQIFRDERGYFMETYQADKYEDLGLPGTFVQDNQAGSEQAVLRGLHYQIRKPQGKLIRVITGEIFDVAVDLRKSSQYFGKWTGMRLSAESKQQLWIPEGFAHGYYVLSEWAEITYKVTDFYAPDWERTLLWNDPEIGITWPLIEGQPPLLSEKDLRGKSLSEAELFD
jgi:dTDP-4-dehydrorhamnose 3,5-epimerase